MGQQARCTNYRPKVGPGNNYISFHGRASETKTRSPAGYLRGLDLSFCIFPSVTFKSPLVGTGLPWLVFGLAEWSYYENQGGTSHCCLIVTTLFPSETPFKLCDSPSVFPSASGYNTVVRIPAGATNIDIKQVSYSGKPEDDNYLGECAVLCCAVRVTAKMSFQATLHNLAVLLGTMNPRWKQSSLLRRIYYTPSLLIL